MSAEVMIEGCGWDDRDDTPEIALFVYMMICTAKDEANIKCSAKLPECSRRASAPYLAFPTQSSYEFAHSLDRTRLTPSLWA